MTSTIEKPKPQDSLDASGKTLQRINIDKLIPGMLMVSSWKRDERTPKKISPVVSVEWWTPVREHCKVTLHDGTVFGVGCHENVWVVI